MDQVLERHKVPKFTQEEIDDPSSPIAIKKLNLELEKKLPKRKVPGTGSLTGKFYQH